MTTAVIDAPTMTLKEADEAISHWQQQLQAAQEAVASHEQNVGQLALANGVDAVVVVESRLRVEAKMAEAGLAAAQEQREVVRRREQAERAQKLRADAKELEAQAEEHAAFYNEWAPKVGTARTQMEHLTHRALQAQRQADEIERRLRQGDPK